MDGAGPGEQARGLGQEGRGEVESSAARRRIARRKAGPFDRRRCVEAAPPALLHGISQLNRGAYFEQHETLEALWLSEAGDVRYLYQGILLVGIGCYHLLRGNHAGAAATLARGITLLRWFEPACQGVDVTRLVADAGRCLDAVRALGPAGVDRLEGELLPRVHLVNAASPGSPGS